MTLPKEKIYDEQINPLMAQIIKICKDNDIAMFANFRLGFDESIEEDLLCTTALPSGSDVDKKAIDKMRKLATGHYDLVPQVFGMTITSGKV